MKIKTFLIAMLLIIANGIAENLPQEVSDIIEQTIEGKRFLDEFDNDKTAIGFKKEDKIEDAKAGKAIKIKIIKKNELENCETDAPVTTITSDLNEFFIPIYVNEEIRCLLYVAMINGTWTDVGIGYSFLAKALEKIITVWPEKSIEIIDVSWLNAYYFHIPELGPKNMTLIEPITDNPNIALSKRAINYTEIDSSNKILNILKDKLNKRK